MNVQNNKKRKLSIEKKKNNTLLSKFQLKSNDNFNSLGNINFSASNLQNNNNQIKLNFNDKYLLEDYNKKFDFLLQGIYNKLNNIDLKLENNTLTNKNYLEDFSKKIFLLEKKIEKINEDINNYYTKINIKYLFKDIENTNTKINKIEDSINELTREINDLQVHALYGNFELNKNKIKEIEDKELENFSHFYN